MKNTTFKFTAILLVFLLAGFGLTAQEKEKEESKMMVMVMKAGKTILDTTFLMDKDFDQEKVEAMVEELDGDSKTINIFKSKGGEAVVYDFSSDIEIDSIAGGTMKWITKEGNKILITEDVTLEENGEGDVVKYVVKKKLGEGEEKEGDTETIIIKKIGEGCEEGEMETEFEVIMDGENTWTTKKNNVLIGHLKGDDISWTTDEGDVHVNVVKGGKHGGQNMMFFSKEREGQISLDSKGDGFYRLEFVSDELEPVKIEVFDGEGNKLFKKKVKNFYGRFLKEVDLGDNETGLFTVRILQGEREIIGEFEYK